MYTLLLSQLLYASRNFLTATYNIRQYKPRTFTDVTDVNAAAADAFRSSPGIVTISSKSHLVNT